MTKLDLINRLKTFLIDEYSQGLRVVILIDESQCTTVDTLEEICLLGNLETKEDKLLHLVLLGQPELDANESVILMSAIPMDSFQAVYSNVLAGLSAQNKTYLVAVFELNFVTNYFQYRLLYYPRATRFDLLQEKQQDLATMVSAGSSQITIASEVNQIIQALNTQGKTL